MREEDDTVSSAQLCRWFGVARSTFYYRPPVQTASRVPIVDTAIIDAAPAARRPMITARARRDAEAPAYRNKIHRTLRLNQWQVRQGHRPGVQAGRSGPRGSTYGGRSTPRISHWL